MQYDTPQTSIYELTYASYSHNRRTFPKIAPQRWTVIFGVRLTELMELRYQREQNPIPAPTGDQLEYGHVMRERIAELNGVRV